MMSRKQGPTQQVSYSWRVTIIYKSWVLSLSCLLLIRFPALTSFRICLALHPQLLRMCCITLFSLLEAVLPSTIQIDLSLPWKPLLLETLTCRPLSRLPQRHLPLLCCTVRTLPWVLLILHSSSIPVWSMPGPLQELSPCIFHHYHQCP